MSGPSPIDLAGLAAGFPLPRLGGDVDKHARGQVLVVAGGSLAPGAAILTGLAALRAGAGKLQLAAAAPAALPLGLAVPEAGVIVAAADARGEFTAEPGEDLLRAAGRADAVVVGPGMVAEETGARLAEALMTAEGGAAFVVDAAAMTGLAPASPAARACRGRLVLTPHPGEMARMLGSDRDAVAADPLDAARNVARALDAVVVMKGPATHVVTPDGRAWRHGDGVFGLATSGSGDVLAGLIGGFLARGAAPLTAALWGVCVHGRAGVRLSRRLGPLGFLARELLAEVPQILAET
jgi:hydroxyethylthiazole kinase-like uncharacterized protein yjeF